MTFFANLLLAVSKVISMVVGIYTFVVAGAVIISWISPDPYNPIVRFIRSVTDPLFERVRSLLPEVLKRQSIDFTPMIVIIILVFFETLVSGTLSDIGIKLKYGAMDQLP